MGELRYPYIDGLTILDVFIKTKDGEPDVEFEGSYKRVIETLQDYIEG